MNEAKKDEEQLKLPYYLEEIKGKIRTRCYSTCCDFMFGSTDCTGCLIFDEYVEYL